MGRAAITSWAGLVALAALASAQTTQGLISGRVVDLGSGRAIVSAEIRCELSDNTLASVGTPSVTRADRSGYFTLPLLSPGFYRIHVQAATYQAQEVYQLEVPVAGRLDIQFRLRPLSDVWETRQYRSVFLPDSEAVLTFYGPDVDTSRSANFDPNRGRPSDLETSLSYVIGAPSIDRLPLGGRDVFTALVLLPSATADTTTGRGLGLSFGGQRPSASNYLLDGLEFNNSLVTGPAARIAPEAVQEYRVSTMNYTAEYGRTSGFIANAITRAATNEWHGLGYFYLKNEALNANTFGNNLQGLSRLPASEIQPGGRIGGPILKRRLFVSASLEYDRFRGESNPQTFVLPTAAFINSTDPASVTGTLLRRFPSAVVPQGTANAGPVTLSPPTALDRYLAMTRFDYASPTGVDQVFLRAVFSSIDQPDFLFNPYREFSSEYRQRDLSLGAGWTHRIRPHLINDLRVGFSFDDPRFSRPRGDIPLLTTQEDIAVGSDLFKVTLPGSGAAYAYRNRNGTFEALDTLVIARGSSIYKFGGGVLRNGTRTYTAALAGGQYSFENLAAFRAATPQVLILVTDATVPTPTFAPYERKYGYKQSFVFFDQSLKLAPHVTFNYGVRYEYFGAPSNIGPNKDRLIQLGTGSSFPQRLAGAKYLPFATGDQQLYDSDHTDGALRMGIAYDVLGKGRAVVRASYGIFYDRPFDNLWQTTSTNRLALDNFTFNGTPVNYLGSPLEAAKLTPISNRDTLDQPVLFQPGLKNGRVQSFFAGVEQRLGHGIVLETNGSGSLGRRLITTDIVNRFFSVEPTDTNFLGALNPNLPLLNYRANQGKSNYFGLSEVLRYRTSRAVAQVSYTWSHTIDLQSEPLGSSILDFNFFSGAGRGPSALAAFSRQFDSQGDRGSADFDQRHNLVFYGSTTLPAGRYRWLRGFEIAGLGAIRSGFPYTVFSFSDLVIFNQRASVAAGAKANIDVPTTGGRLLLDPTAFVRPQIGTIGNTGRNAFRGPGLFNVDLSIARRFAVPHLGERARVTLRADAFNLLNHANLGNPLSFLGADNFGVAGFGRQEASSGFPVLAPLNETPRQIQILMRFEF